MTPSQPIVAGMDPDTRRIAYAVTYGAQVLHVATVDRTTSKGRFLPAYDSQITTVMRWLQQAGAVLYLEGIYLPRNDRGQKIEARNVKTFQQLAKVHGELEQLARLHRVPTFTAAPVAWQAAQLKITKGREAIKKESKRLAAELWPAGTTEHEADAIQIALYGGKQHKGSTDDH